jgi:hypothetical protein
MGPVYGTCACRHVGRDIWMGPDIVRGAKAKVRVAGERGSVKSGLVGLSVSVARRRSGQG